MKRGFPGSLVVKNLPANTGDAVSIPGSERSPRGGNGNPLQYSCLENPMDRGAWRATVHRVAELNTLGMHARPDLITRPIANDPLEHKSDLKNCKDGKLYVYLPQYMYFFNF